MASDRTVLAMRALLGCSFSCEYQSTFRDRPAEKKKKERIGDVVDLVKNKEL